METNGQTNRWKNNPVKKQKNEFAKENKFAGKIKQQKGWKTECKQGKLNQMKLE